MRSLPRAEEVRFPVGAHQPSSRSSLAGRLRAALLHGSRLPARAPVLMHIRPWHCRAACKPPHQGVKAGNVKCSLRAIFRMTSDISWPLTHGQHLLIARMLTGKREFGQIYYVKSNGAPAGACCPAGNVTWFAGGRSTSQETPWITGAAHGVR